MKKSTLILASMLVALGANSIQAANLWIIGDATPYGWSLDDATALLSTPENSSLYSGTIYLKANEDFKFMSVPDFGNTDYPQYGAAPDATLTDGKIDLASGSNDEGYGKIQVPESANYYITINTEALVATIVKAEYQTTQIGLCSLFLVGDATSGGWSVDDGTPLFQDKDTPYVYSADVELKNGSFKIATVMKGAGSWDPKYYYFCDPEDSGKIILANTEDTQWQIAENATYNVSVNTIQNTINIVKTDGSDSVDELVWENGLNGATEYFTLTGVKVANPSNGIFIVKKGNKVYKQILK